MNTKNTLNKHTQKTLNKVKGEQHTTLWSVKLQKQIFHWAKVIKSNNFPRNIFYLFGLINLVQIFLKKLKNPKHNLFYFVCITFDKVFVGPPERYGKSLIHSLEL